MAKNEEVVDLVRKIKFLHSTDLKGVAELAGVSYGYLSNVMNGHHPFNKDLKERLENLCKDEEYLAEGIVFQGEGAIAPDISQCLPFIGDGAEDVVAGELAGFGEGIDAKLISDHVLLPLLSKRDGDFAIRTRGRSMIDIEHPDQNINDGAIVCVRPWHEKHIQWGEIYCIATTSGYAVKRLMPSDNEDSIRCVSSNEEEGYMPYDVEKRDIKGIGKVTAIINLQLL